MEEFLRERGVDDTVIKKFTEEKVDEDLVRHMTDEDLLKLGLTMGDRIALRAYVNSKSAKSQEQSSLLNRVKDKLRNPGKGRWQSLRSNTHAKADLRTVEFGWMNRDSTGLKQVRSRTGGGTRNVKVATNTTVSELRNLAVGYFFPNGSSEHRGNASDYKISMVNFDCGSISAEETVQNLYAKSAHRTLRLYMLTEAADCSDEAPVTLEQPKRSAESEHTLEVVPVKRERACDDGKSITEQNNIDPPGALTGVASGEEARLAIVQVEHSLINEEELSIATDIVVHNSMEQSFDDEIFFNIGSPQKLEVWLHRGMFLHELEDFFIKHNFDIKRNTLSVKIISPNGDIEQAEDSGGVLRDVLSEYWNTFYDNRSMGRDLKVPVISHAVDGVRWKASSKILLVGYHLEEYFPVKLASCFLDYVVHGDNVDIVQLMDQYVNSYLAQPEKEVVKKALDDFDSVEFEEILDFLSDHQCKTVPKKENFKKIIQEVAHKEILQVPTFVAENWRESVVQCHGLMAAKGCNFQDMNNKVPSFKEVWKSVSISPEVNQDISSYLKKYLKEMDVPELQNFLRYCTGADIIVGKTIRVTTFKPDSEFTRRPIAHTCGCTLELPDTYESFVTFRAEFHKILTSGIWVMDIV